MQVLQDFHKIAVMFCLSLLSLSACEQPSEAPRITAKTIATVEALLDDVARTETALNPQMASRLGLDMDYARDARRNLNGTSQAAFERARLLRLDLQARLTSRPNMPEDHPLARDLIITMDALQRLIDLQKSGYGRLSLSENRPYTIDPFSGLWIEGPETLIQDHVIETPQDAEDYLLRLSALADGLQDTRRRLLVDAQTGHLPPAPLLQETRRKIEALRASGALVNIVDTLSDFSAALDFRADDRRETLVISVQEKLNQEVDQAYLDLIATVSELEPQAPLSAGLWVQPGGTALYTDLLAAQAAPGLDLETLWQEIQNDLSALKQTVAATQSPPPEEADITPDLSAPSAEEAVSLLFPDHMGIIRIYMPTSKPALTGLRFRPARFDDRRPALTEVDEARFALWPAYFQSIYTDQNRLEAELAYSRVIRTAATRSPVRGVIDKQAFREGWLVYRQKQSFDEPDQYLLFITVLAAADLGLHDQRWSLEETIDFIETETGLDSALCNELGLRIAAKPAEALAVYIHYARFVSLANRTRQILDKDFDQTAFNTVLLKDGARPLVLVERDVETWYQNILENRN